MFKDFHPEWDRRAVLTGIGAAVTHGAISSAQAKSPEAGNIPAQTQASGPPASSDAAARGVAGAQDVILRISRKVWETPELSLQEQKSHQLHINELESAGFRIVSRGTSGVPTAFVAEWSRGSGGPVIGFLTEYDALPGLGNAAEPRRTPGPTGAEVGHGCGHNMLGAGCTGGAMVLRGMMEAANVAGTVRVYGCAAEETEGAKVYMARDGLFADMDAALAWHPAPFAGAGVVRLTALNKIKVSFRGRTAHAGNTPWEGRSALKAAELFGMGVQMMREHLEPSARIHYIYESAGVAPNIIPDFAQILIVYRDTDRTKVDASTRWLRQVADGAAMMTQTEADFDQFHGVHDLLPNEPLARHLLRHIEAIPLEWTSDEQNFARACQREMMVAEDGMSLRALPFLNDIAAGASTDVGDVSYQVPCGLFAWPTFPQHIGLHTWPVTACGGMSIGDKASLNTARILAGAGYDLMTDASLRQAAKADFAQRRGAAPFVSPLPPDRRQPLGLGKFVKTGDDEIFADIRRG